jgi:hypothetical protein
LTLNLFFVFVNKEVAEECCALETVVVPGMDL